MSGRNYSLLDHCLMRADLVLLPLRHRRKHTCNAADHVPAEPPLTLSEVRQSVQLMRINHAGEVAAQGLYTGHALVARKPENLALFSKLAAEEAAHLQWCEDRLQRLRGRTSVLNPFWLTGSVLIGALAGLAGDDHSLGFVVETEKQVEAHLQRHLDQLPVNDTLSRSVLERMQRDEARHAQTASRLGGSRLSYPIRTAMKVSSRVMTTLARWI